MQINSVSTTVAAPQSETPIGLDDWPKLCPNQLRHAFLFDGTVGTERLQQALTNAYLWAYAQLSPWLQQQGFNNFNSYASTQPQFEKTTIPTQYFSAAVFNWAAADINSKLVQFDTARQGTQNANKVEQTIIDMRSAAIAAIRAITGNGRGFVELI